MQKKRFNSLFFKLAKLLLAFALLYFIISPFLPDNSFDIFTDSKILNLKAIPYFLLPLILVFSVFNFIIESLKWKIAVSQIEDISLLKALKATFAGVAISNVFPWRTGEFVGKIAFLKEENRVKGSYMAVYSSMTQLFVTLLAGVFGFIFYFDKTNYTFLQAKWFDAKISLWLVLIFLFLILFLFVFRNKILLWIKNIAGKKLSRYFSDIKQFSTALTFKLILLSFLRYLFFILPYFILIIYESPDTPYLDVVFGITLVFLIQSLIPGFLFSDLPIKGIIHITVFAYLIPQNWIVGNAVLVVFVANQIIPSIIGGALLIMKKYNNIEQQSE